MALKMVAGPPFTKVVVKKPDPKKTTWLLKIKNNKTHSLLFL